MADVKHKVERAAFGAAIDGILKYVNKDEEDREKAFLKLVDLSEKFMGNTFSKESYDAARRMIREPDSKWMQYVNRILNEVDPHVIKMSALDYGFEAAFCGKKEINEMRVKHQCNIPWLILMDPTSACNLHCTGCWAAEYGNKLNLSFDEIDSIITQGKEMGVYFYIYTGGEPLVQMEFLTELFTKAKERNINTCLDTSGILFRQEKREAFDKLMAVTDLVMLDIKHIDDTEHRKLTGQSNVHILEFAQYLKEKNIPVWIRHVVVPGITLQEKYLRQLGAYLAGLDNLKALDVLPYHTMGEVKYENLGIPYPLKGVESATTEQAIWAKNIILDALKEQLRKEKFGE